MENGQILGDLFHGRGDSHGPGTFKRCLTPSIIRFCLFCFIFVFDNDQTSQNEKVCQYKVSSWILDKRNFDFAARR